MAFQKIPKEEWLKLSQEERDYITLQFNQSIEKRKRTALIVTRGIAIFCVFALFFIGYSQLEASRSYGAIKEKYGNNAYCYLCGLENLKKCECVYTTTKDFGNIEVIKPNLTKLSLELAENNIQKCLSYEQHIKKLGEEAGFNFTLERPAVGPKINNIPSFEVNLSDLS
jgi:hypothetical protein